MDVQDCVDSRLITSDVEYAEELSNKMLTMFNVTLHPDVPTLGLLVRVVKDSVDDLVVHVEAASGQKKSI